MQKKCTNWSEALAGIGHAVGEEKKAFDRLRRGVKASERLVKPGRGQGEMPTGDTLLQRHDRYGKASSLERPRTP